jgi:hypothetical protein
MLTTICIGLIKDNTLHSPLLFVLPKDGRKNNGAYGKNAFPKFNTIVQATLHQHELLEK